MSKSTLVSSIVSLALVATTATGCDDEKSTSAPATATATAAPAPTPEAKPSAPAASAEPEEPHHDCPEGSTGPGSFKKPCEAKGTARMMEVTWTGKQTDTGPSFRVVSKSKLEILYGKVAVYFYDKAGKQLEVKVEGEGKGKPMQVCSGNIFDGPMKPAEKAVITFSCVKAKHVPEGTAAIEAEMEVVGFSDASSKKNEFYWQNKELTPDARPKGKKK
ncbi:MAG: hypothetical protein IPI67_03920 [Myxococcales bacterium]|nr:hypothetical protein [Myxococcales bacterium]